MIVSLTRLDGVRNVDADAGHMTVEAGMTLEAAHEVADKAGALLPLTIASQGTAEIGGVLSSNAGGVQVLSLWQCARPLPRRRGGSQRRAAL